MLFRTASDADAASLAQDNCARDVNMAHFSAICWPFRAVVAPVEMAGYGVYGQVRPITAVLTYASASKHMWQGCRKVLVC
jgi:hypothetical protein